MPRTRPPFPAVSGLWGKPTNINNVETFANVRLDHPHGAPRRSPPSAPRRARAPRPSSLAGKIVNGGLVEVPMGSTAAPGHLRRRRRHQGRPRVQGRPDRRSLGRLRAGEPPRHAGRLRVARPRPARSWAPAAWSSPTRRPVWSTSPRYFLQFTQNESCGKCVPCRLGTKRMLEILERITARQGRGGRHRAPRDARATTIKATSLCGLGQTAPNPVLTTIRYFRHEYEAHIAELRCPALACESLISYVIDPDACTGCTLCAKKCPAQAAHGARKQAHVIDQDKCVTCDACRAACKFDAVRIVSGPEQIAEAVAAQAVVQG